MRFIFFLNTRHILCVHELSHHSKTLSYCYTKFGVHLSEIHIRFALVLYQIRWLKNQVVFMVYFCHFLMFNTEITGHCAEFGVTLMFPMITELSLTQT